MPLLRPKPIVPLGTPHCIIPPVLYTCVPLQWPLRAIPRVVRRQRTMRNNLNTWIMRSTHREYILNTVNDEFVDIAIIIFENFFQCFFWKDDVQKHTGETRCQLSYRCVFCSRSSVVIFYHFPFPAPLIIVLLDGSKASHSDPVFPLAVLFVSLFTDPVAVQEVVRGQRRGDHRPRPQ